MKNNIIKFIFVIAVIISLSVLFRYGLHHDEKTDVSLDQPLSIETENPVDYNDKVYDTLGDLKPLKLLIEENLQQQEGDWAVYIENLTTGDKFDINNHKMVSASLIKLFIMGGIYKEIEANNIVWGDVNTYLESMITVSDNEASNILVSKLGNGYYTDMYEQSFKDGLVKVNDFAALIGCTDTEQQRDMMNSRIKPIVEQNYTSVVDCGTFLSMLYHQQLVSESFDVEMLARLKRQTRCSKIPAGLPAGTICANKTGELSDVENDVAIVFSPKCDYIICVMANNLPNTSIARENITSLSETVYQFFNATTN